MTISPQKPRMSDIDIQNYNRSIVEDELFTPDKMYLDWSLFRDPAIGAAITLLMDHPDQKLSAVKFASMTNRIDAYQERDCSDVCHYFPELDLTPDIIRERLLDPTYQERIFHAAPFTLFIQILRAQLNVNINHSAVREKFKKVPVRPGKYRRDYDAIRLSINTYPLQLPERIQALIGVFFTRNYAVDVEILSIAPKDLDVSFLEKMDEIYTNNLVELLDNAAFSQALTDLRFVNKSIFAVRHLGMVRPWDLKLRAAEAEFIRLRSTLDVMSKFEWILPSAISYDLVPPIPN